MVWSFRFLLSNEIQEHFFQVVCFATETLHTQIAVFQDEVQHLILGCIIVVDAHLPGGMAVIGFGA
jgi:hypothetical protein